MTNMLKKVFNWSKVHLSEVTFYKIHTLIKNLGTHKTKKKVDDENMPIIFLTVNELT
jgi:hypothetical protein